MKATYNKSKIMRNAWYMMKRKLASTFSAALRKAWRNEKLAVMTARVEGRTTEEPTTTTYRPELLQVPANYYGVANRYYGD